MEDDPALSVAADDAAAREDIADADESPNTINAIYAIFSSLVTTKMSQRIFWLGEHPYRHYTCGAVQHHGVNVNIARDYISCALARSHGTTRS